MIIYSKWFTDLFGVYGAAWFPGIIIVRPGASDALIRHERIHLRQQLELLYFGFIILYLILLAIKGYKNHPMEREAFGNQRKKTYLKKRKWYAWTKYF